MSPDWRTARLSTSRFWTPAEGRLKRARCPKPWAAGHSVRWRSRLSCYRATPRAPVLLAPRPEVACPELKKSQADCKVGLPLAAGLDASDHPARVRRSFPKRRAKIAERTRSVDAATKSPRLEIRLDPTMRASWSSSSVNFIELGRKRRVANSVGNAERRQAAKGRPSVHRGRLRAEPDYSLPAPGEDPDRNNRGSPGGRVLGNPQTERPPAVPGSASRVSLEPARRPSDPCRRDAS
jgi:hypothetical protein